MRGETESGVVLPSLRPRTNSIASFLRRFLSHFFYFNIRTVWKLLNTFGPSIWVFVGEIPVRALVSVEIMHSWSKFGYYWSESFSEFF